MIKTYVEKRYSDPYAVPFYVENLTGANNTLSIAKNNNNAPTVTVEYSTDEQNWATLGRTSRTPLTYNIPAGGRVYLRANANAWGNTSQYNKITASGNYAVGGNIMSLLYKDNFAQQTTLSTEYTFNSLFTNSRLVKADNLLMPATTLANGCYIQMFGQCTSLTSAPALPATTLAVRCYSEMFYSCTALTAAPALPATTLAAYCYNRMFHNCTSLATAPALPATTLANSCYYQLFLGCTSLTAAPALPATTLADSCYYRMFKDCTSLTTAPALPATTLAVSCYNQMFNSCTSLTTAPELPVTTLASQCYMYMFSNCSNLNSINVSATSWDTSYTTDWVLGVSATGTFTKPSDTTIPEGTSGIPSGWTVINV